MSSQSPEGSLDEYLHLGPPVFLYNERRKDSFRTLKLLISTYAGALENVLLYNVPLPIVHRLVSSTRTLGARLRDSARKGGQYKLSVLFTNGDNAYFDHIEHEKNRQLRLSGAVANFLSTVVESKPPRKIPTLKLLGSCSVLHHEKAGVIRGVLDQKVHVGLLI